MAEQAAYESFLAIKDDNSLRARVLPCSARGLAACPAASFAAAGFPLDRFWYTLVLTILVRSPRACLLIYCRGLLLGLDCLKARRIATGFLIQRIQIHHWIPLDHSKYSTGSHVTALRTARRHYEYDIFI